MTFELTAKGGDVYDQWVGHGLDGINMIDALNAEPAEDGGYYLGLRNVDTGKAVALLMDYDFWAVPSSQGMQGAADWMAYAPDASFCYPTTDFVAINLSLPPFDQLDARQALAAATDQETYQMDWGWGESQAAYSFIPPQSCELCEATSNLGDLMHRQASFYAAAYCGECTDNDLMMAYLVENWKEYLGVEVELVALSNADFYAPLTEGDFGVVLKAVYGSSWYDFVKIAVDIGWLMVPDSEYEAYKHLVHEAAMEADREKQAEMIAELNRLLVEEYVSVIPLITYETCVESYQTWDEVHP